MLAFGLFDRVGCQVDLACMVEKRKSYDRAMNDIHVRWPGKSSTLNPYYRIQKPHLLVSQNKKWVPLIRMANSFRNGLPQVFASNVESYGWFFSEGLAELSKVAPLIIGIHQCSTYAALHVPFGIQRRSWAVSGVLLMVSFLWGHSCRPTSSWISKTVRRYNQKQQ